MNSIDLEVILTTYLELSLHMARSVNPLICTPISIEYIARVLFDSSVDLIISGANRYQYWYQDTDMQIWIYTTVLLMELTLGVPASVSGLHTILTAYYPYV